MQITQATTKHPRNMNTEHLPIGALLTYDKHNNVQDITRLGKDQSWTLQIRTPPSNLIEIIKV